MEPVSSDRSTVTVRAPDPDIPVHVGLDGGGTGLRVRAVRGGTVVFEGSGGPMNVAAMAAADLLANLEKTLDGCPEPLVMSGCFAGVSTGTAGLISDILGDLVPSAQIRIAPDHLAVALAGTDGVVCVIAGTGSVCVSLDGLGYHLTGGLGHLLGDFGSGFRYGSALLRMFLDHREVNHDSEVRCSVSRTFGTLDRGELLSLVYTSPGIVPALAGLTRTLAERAAAGAGWAMGLIEQESYALALDVLSHVDRNSTDLSGVPEEMAVILAGGVWKNMVIRRSFENSLRKMRDDIEIRIRLCEDPVEGAVRLAMMENDEVDSIIWGFGPNDIHLGTRSGKKVVHRVDRRT